MLEHVVFDYENHSAKNVLFAVWLVLTAEPGVRECIWCCMDREFAGSYSAGHVSVDDELDEITDLVKGDYIERRARSVGSHTKVGVFL